MAQNLQTLIPACDEYPALPAATQAVLQRASAIYDVVLRINAFLDFQSVALLVVDQAGNLCVAASFGDIPKIYRAVQPTFSITEIADGDDWFFLPQGALTAAMKVAADELLRYNWHPDDVLCVPVSNSEIPLTAFLGLGKPRDHRVVPKNMQALHGCVRWLMTEFENAHLLEKLSQADAARQRAEAALAAQKRRTGTLTLPSLPPEPPPPGQNGITKNDGDIEIELLQRNRELLSLQAAISATASSLDVPFVLETVTWEVANLLNVEGCTVSEWHETDDAAMIIAKYGLENWWEQGEAVGEDTIYPLKRQVITEKYAAQATINQPDIRRDDRAYMTQAGLKTILLLPMIFQNDVLGTIEVFDTETERIFTDREISLAQLLANQAATALANARLYRQAQTELIERKKANEKIAASLREKEILLKEIHHRVKNNLQVISSLLYLQSRHVEEPTVLQVLQESRTRVQTMAMIHEKLYQTEDLAEIDFAEYLRSLTRELVFSYRQTAQQVEITIEGGDVRLDINTAVPCGLIVNELVSNALKHAFPPEKASADGDAANEIKISLKRQQDEITLCVRDNGVGIPEDVGVKKSDSLGMQLVTMLARQIHGTVTIERDNGTAFAIVFPVP